ncbi:MAG: hypothetical protein HKO89_06445, partial [Saprospiraceae bacterium]|nr:hypothetical protein [Saprospiraceae bacterium]
PIQVIYRLAAKNNKLMLTIKGEQALGTRFRAGSQTNVCGLPNTTKRENHFISVMATEDNTWVNFEFMPGIDMWNLEGMHSIALNKGETYLVRDNNTNQTVAGSLITSDKPIAVISGSQHTLACSGGRGRDGGADQLVPSCVIGTEYIVSRGSDDDDPSPSNYAAVVAVAGMTEVYINGSSNPVATLMPGEFYNYFMPGPDGSVHYIRTSKPAYVYQFGSVQHNGELGMAIVSSIDECKGDMYVEFKNFPNSTSNTAHVIIPNDGLSSLTLNQEPYTNFGTPKTIPGLQGWSMIQFDQSVLSGLQDPYILQSDKFFHVASFVGNSSGGTFGYLTSFKEKIEVLHPETQEPTVEYFIDTICGGQLYNHCIDAFSCAGNPVISQIIDLPDNGNVEIVNGSLCFDYTGPEGYCGFDEIVIQLVNDIGIVQPVCLSFYVCSSPADFICPADLEVDCSIDVPAPLQNFVAFEQEGGVVGCSCDLDTLSFQLITEEFQSINCTQDITRTYGIYDTCGMISECSHMIIITDSLPPMIDSEPELLSIPCDVPGNDQLIENWTDNSGNATAFDNCGIETTAFELLEEEITGSGTLLRQKYLYTVTDSCGNTSSAEAIIEFIDNEAPQLIESASDTSIVNNNQVFVAIGSWLMNNGGAIASDNCSELEWSNDFITIDTSITNNSVLVTFTATDENGNSIQISATIYLVDDTQPELITEAQDVTITCDQTDLENQYDNWLITNGGAVAQNLCTPFTWTQDVVDVQEGCGEEKITEVLFTVTDTCGNILSTSASFRVIDSQAPAFIQLPQDLVLTGSDEAENRDQVDRWIEKNGGAIAEEKCGQLYWDVKYSEATLGCGSDIVGIADFIVIDECGNSNVATAYVYNSGNKIVSNSYSAGSAIINMSVMPQTYENGLLPYGLIYELAGLQIPVDWVIKRAKKLNDIDFSIDGIEFRSGAFIIRREFMDNDRSVRPLLSEWEAKGVVIHFASTDFNAPLYKTIRSFPKVIIDGNNAQLIENAFYNRSDIPAEAYSKGLPSDLGSCEQLYVLTHGDPHTWNLDEVSILKNYLENGGSIWVGCHAVSAFETYTNSSMEDACISDLNLLSNSGMIPWSNSNSCSIEKHNNSNNTPFAYDSLRGSLPVFQFMGRMDKAYQAGSEQIMMPNPDGWRSTTQLLVTDTMHSQVLANGGALSPGPAALVAYGPAYGDIELGKVLYQTSHNIATGDEQEDVAAARLFGNFLLESSGSGNTLEVCSSVVTEEVSCGIEYVLDAEVKSSTPFISNWNSNCSGIIINPDSLRARYIPVDSESGDCIIRLTVSNDCNHIDYIAHNIVLIDTIEPELIKEAEDLVLVYEDSASMQLKIQQWLDMHGMAEAIDDCNLNWENNYVPFSISLADLPYTYPVTFFADDDKKSAGVVTLGNIIVVVQPGDLVVECDGSGNVAELTNWLDTHAGVVISGLCVDQVWTDDFTGLSDDCGETGSATVTFTVTDNCSNQATITASFTIVDTQSPNLVCPPDTLGNCSISEIQPYLTLLDFINAGGIADDMCAVDSTSFFPISEVTDEGECPETYTRVYVVSDECGNGSTCSQDIILQFKEEDAPSISCPPQITIDCHIDNAPPYATFDEFLTAGGSASDGCQIDSTSLTLLSQGADKFCGGSVTRVYEISDMCGNKDNCQHKIIVDDTTVPTISCPDTIYGLCLITEIPPYTYTEFLDAGGSASDNCGLDTLTFGQAGLSHDNQDCPRTYLRTYEIEDDCGNVAECDQTIIIHDTIPPVLTCPDTLFLVCNILEEGPFSTYNNFLNGGATGFDDCEINTNSFTLLSEISNGESCPETVTRTYEVSDECGNATSCDQIVFINDEIAPTVQCPNDLTADCNDNLPAPYTDFPAFDSAPNGSASDNCAINGFSVELISETSNNASCPEGITRVYAVSDGCDNQATCEQVITVNDFIEPVFICPDDFTANVCDIIEEPPYTNLIQFL